MYCVCPNSLSLCLKMMRVTSQGELAEANPLRSLHPTPLQHPPQDFGVDLGNRLGGSRSRGWGGVAPCNVHGGVALAADAKSFRKFRMQVGKPQFYPHAAHDYHHPRTACTIGILTGECGSSSAQKRAERLLWGILTRDVTGSAMANTK
jgi:hypothetical protein